MITFQLLETLNANLFQLLGLEQLGEKEKKEILNRLETVVSDRILLKAIEQLEPSDKSHFLNLLENDSKSPEEVFSFLEQKIPDFASLAEEEIARFKLDLARDATTRITDDVVLAELNKELD